MIGDAEVEHLASANFNIGALRRGQDPLRLRSPFRRSCSRELRAAGLLLCRCNFGAKAV
jgi:hypothetical protein